MTRTYRMYIDQGISDRLMRYIRHELPTAPAYVGRFKPTNFSRGSNASWFDYELIILIDGTEYSFASVLGVDTPQGVGHYYNTYNQIIQEDIMFGLVRQELLLDSGRPTRIRTHKYKIEPAVMLTTTHLYDVIGFISQAMTHKYNVES